MLFSIFLFGFSSAMIDNVHKVEPSLNKVICNSYSSLDKWIYGDPTINWVGIEKMDDMMDSIIA